MALTRNGRYKVQQFTDGWSCATILCGYETLEEVPGVHLDDIRLLDTVTGGIVTVSVEPTGSATLAVVGDYGANTVVVRYDYPSGYHGRHFCRGFDDWRDFCTVLADAAWELEHWTDSADGKASHAADAYHSALTGGR